MRREWGIGVGRGHQGAYAPRSPEGSVFPNGLNTAGKAEHAIRCEQKVLKGTFSAS